ncbi:hypothetical protein B4U84_24035 [Westiellopsis prolifica IICB1]|nr:hypothetical protein B4U84_24035 [Westiellopsis prolifica IICB1]
MKTQLLVNILGAGAMTLAAIGAMSQPSSAQAKTYYCSTSDDGVPTTFARTVTRKPIQVIRWEFSLGGLKPAQRCQIVSDNFQKAYEQGQLNYLTWGFSNKTPVICAVSQYARSCRDGMLLFTLKRKEDASLVLQHLDGYTAGGPLVQSEDGSPHTNSL